MKEPFNEGSFFYCLKYYSTVFLDKDAKHLFPRHKQTSQYNLYPKHITSRNLFFRKSLAV